jgi:hypothetical protein
MTYSPLSPAAQAILDAHQSTSVRPVAKAQIAAALRAAADQVAPENYDSATDDPGWNDGAEDRNAEIRERILAIAAELEAQ